MPELSSRANYHDRAVSMPHDRIGDAAYQGSSYPSETSAPHHDKPRTNLLRRPDYRRIRVPYQEV